MNKILPLLIVFCLPVFSVEMQEEVYQFENLRIVKKPTSHPKGMISSDFIPEKSVIVQSVELGSMTGMSSETALFLQSPQSAEELVKFYETILQAKDWRVLQKDNKGNKFVILGENPSKKVMTVLIRDEKDYRVVKIFYRRPGF